MSETYESTNQSVHSPAWIAFTQLTFAVSVVAMAAGIVLLPVELAAQGYLAMGMLLTVVASINMSKTLRDQHEAGRLTRKVEEAKLNNFLINNDPLATGL